MNPNEIRQAYIKRIRRALDAIAPIRGEIFTAVTDGDQSLYEARRALRNCIALLDTADDEAFLHAESEAEIVRLRAALAETWQPVLDRTPTPCTCGFCDGRVFQDHGILHILQGDVNLAVHLPDDVRLCRKE